MILNFDETTDLHDVLADFQYIYNSGTYILKYKPEVQDDVLLLIDDLLQTKNEFGDCFKVVSLSQNSFLIKKIYQKKDSDEIISEYLKTHGKKYVNNDNGTTSLILNQEMHDYNMDKIMFDSYQDAQENLGKNNRITISDKKLGFFKRLKIRIKKYFDDLKDI